MICSFTSIIPLRVPMKKLISLLIICLSAVLTACSIEPASLESLIVEGTTVSTEEASSSETETKTSAKESTTHSTESEEAQTTTAESLSEEEPAALLAGGFQDAVSGELLPGKSAVVVNIDTREQCAVIADDSGEFTEWLMPGKYKISVDLEGYDPYVESFELKKDKTTLLIIRLTPVSSDTTEPPTTTTSSPPATATSDPYAGIYEVNLKDQHLSVIPDLSAYPDLVSVDLMNNNITDLTPLSGLTRLTKLWLAGNPITNLRGISSLVNLDELGIGECGLADISGISSLKKLRILDFWYSEISDISELSALTNLEEIYMSFSNVTTLRPIMDLPKLKVISIRGLNIPESEINEFIQKHPACTVYRF